MDDYLPRSVMLAFAAVGISFVLYTLAGFFRMLLSLFVLPGRSLRAFGHKGSWAIITGASDGIGKEFSLQLAAKGYNVLLISRTKSKLESLAQEIYSKYGVETETYAMDFARNDDQDYENLSGILSNLPNVSILINNVGLSHSIPVPFAETSEEEMNSIIIVNCIGTLRMTKLVAPYFIQRKRGLILTMASFGGVLPTPLLATYSGSKAFLQHWSSALGSELAPYNITVQLVQSYLVTSAMSKIKRPSMMVPTPKQFVKAALSKIGRSGGAGGIAYTSAPYWSHGIMLWALETFTGTRNKFVIDFNKKMHEGIRKRALTKAEREGKKIE